MLPTLRSATSVISAPLPIATLITTLPVSHRAEGDRRRRHPQPRSAEAVQRAVPSWPDEAGWRFRGNAVRRDDEQVRVLITGHRGNVGVPAAAFLRSCGYEARP
jgi:hypothetical protein